MEVGKYYKWVKILAGIFTSRYAFTGPYTARISLCDRCKYKCIMCPSHSPLLADIQPKRESNNYFEKFGQSREREKRAMLDIKLVKDIIDDLSEMDVGSIVFTAFGEPFLHPKILEAIEYVKYKNMHCSVTSNGALITEDMALKLVELGLDNLNISINSASPETYVQIHVNQPSNNFYNICNVLKLMVEEKKIRKQKLPHIGLSAVICSINAHEIEEMAKLAAEIGVNSFGYAKIVVFEQTKHLLPISKQINEIINQVVKAKSILNSAGIQSSFQIEKSDWIKSGLKSQEFFSRIPCYIGWMLCLISANGNVYPCCGCSKKMGNVKENSYLFSYRIFPSIIMQ